MGKRLNIQAQSLSYGTVANLLNGAFASLSGPVGFTPTQPRIIVKSISVTNPTGTAVEFAIYKGASGAETSGTEVLAGNADAMSTVELEQDLVLDAVDFLTGAAKSNTSAGPIVVNVSAEIGF